MRKRFKRALESAYMLCFCIVMLQGSIFSKNRTDGVQGSPQNPNSPGSSCTSSPSVTSDSFFMLQPTPCTIKEGEPLFFTVIFECDAFTVRWQYLPAGADTWYSLPNANDYTLNYTPTLAENGRLYRCVVCDLHTGAEYVSASALLTILPL